MDVFATAVFDLANPNIASFGLVVTETPDEIPPVLTAAILNYDNGFLVLILANDGFITFYQSRLFKSALIRVNGVTQFLSPAPNCLVVKTAQLLQ